MTIPGPYEIPAVSSYKSSFRVTKAVSIIDYFSKLRLNDAFLMIRKGFKGFFWFRT